nr:hypothetical protein K-LCC10_0280 [Kaumoebavirus]
MSVTLRTRQHFIERTYNGTPQILTELQKFVDEINTPRGTNLDYIYSNLPWFIKPRRYEIEDDDVSEDEEEPVRKNDLKSYIV